MRPQATSVWGLKLLLVSHLSHLRVWGLKLLLMSRVWGLELLLMSHLSHLRRRRATALSEMRAKLVPALVYEALSY
jgi:hypothetical protein